LSLWEHLHEIVGIVWAKHNSGTDAVIDWGWQDILPETSHFLFDIFYLFVCLCFVCLLLVVVA